MTAKAFVSARIDEDLRDEAATVLAGLGLTVSDVVRMTLTRVARDKALPFALKVPNAETKAAMREVRSMAKQRAARFAEPQDLLDAIEKQAS